MMVKNEFLQLFNLQPLSPSTHTYQHPSSVRNAAVLVGIIDTGKTLEVLLTKRAEHLKHHPGQISFPGGKAESFDASIIDTALRETQEEIGLHLPKTSVIGQLNEYQTISGYIVTPIIALIEPSSYHIDTNEVSEVFHVPLNFLLNPNNYHQVRIIHERKPHYVNYIPYKNYKIWGATAAMLKDLALHINASSSEKFSEIPAS